VAISFRGLSAKPAKLGYDKPADSSQIGPNRRETRGPRS